MSDSDDTDLLLLIPPDFFLVETSDLDEVDSEENFLLGNNQLVEESVVNDLITHVNELENRICLIERLDSSRLSALDNNTLSLNQSYSGSNSFQTQLLLAQVNDYTNYSSMSDSVCMLSGSIDSVQQNHYLKSRNDFVSPPRPRQPFSLPSTPTNGAYNKSEFQPSRLNYKEIHNPNNVYTHLEDDSGKNNIDNAGSERLTAFEKQNTQATKSNFFPNHAVTEENHSVIHNSKGIPEEKDLLGEIDQYLSDVERHGGIFKNKDEELHTYALKDPFIGNGLKIMAENCDNLTNNENNSVKQHLDLPEVDRLLKEMEATQNQIEQKLKLHNPSKRTVNTIPDKTTYYSRIGENAGSIPDLGFGLKEFYTNDAKKNIGVSDENSYPTLIEEPFVKKNVLPLSENDKKPDYNSVINMSAVDNSFIQNRHSPSSRRRLDMDFRYKVIDKQPQIITNYRSHDQNMKKVYKPTNMVDLANSPNAFVKSTQGFESQNHQPSINKHASPTKFNISKHLGLDSLRDKFNSERDRRLQLIQSQETAENHTSSQKSGYNSQSNQSRPMDLRKKVSDDYQSSNDVKQQPVEIPLKHDKQTIVIENWKNYPSLEKPSSSNLLSLTDLWNREPIFHSDDPNKLRQKLEEEKYRRQDEKCVSKLIKRLLINLKKHCEEKIQNLQYRVLEEQEKLAVAVRVDQEKDKAIIQLTDAWRKLVKHWEELEEQRHSLAQQLQTEKELNKTKIEEMTKKVNRWETEVAQALDLAAGYKEKCEDITKEKDSLKHDLKTRIEDAEKQIEDVSQQNEQFLIERNEMKQQIEQYRRIAEEDKKSIKEAQMELIATKKQLSQYEAEINVLKEQKQGLSEKLKDEKAHSTTLEQQKLGLQQSLDEIKKKEKASRDEARMYGERIEVARTELRALYQGQLEAVVREKLKEFQNQLDAAEAALKAELQAREKLWADKANSQCQLLSERYKAELQHVQSQHREELRSWRMKVIDCERLKSAIESQLQEETDRRTDIAQRLHGVMETQWRQALKIITHPNAVESNANPTSQPEQEMKTMQLQRPEKNHNVPLDLKNIHSKGSSVASVAPNDDFPFGEEGKATYRLADDQPQPDQLKKYIQMLLDRAPGNPVDGSGLWHESIAENPLPSPGSSFGGRWSAFMPLQDDKKTNNSQENRPNSDGQSNNKPPWK